MERQTVITHALNQGPHALPMGTRARYTGTQNWGPATVTVTEPWGGLSNPLYVVIPDGMDARFTYVVAESELSPVGVSLAKPSDRDVAGVEYAPAPVRGSWMLKRNDLDQFADWFKIALARAGRVGA